MWILLIEGDMLIDNGIKTGLSKVGFSVDWSTQGCQGKEALYSAPYDVVILDLTLSGMDGRDILCEWQEEGQRKPVLILATRDALVERVEGLRLGAGDYPCKPFALIEVAVRLEAPMRRINGQASNELHRGSIMFDPGKRIATLAGEPLMSKPKEFTLLELLIRNVGRVPLCKLIEGKLYTRGEEVTSNAVGVHVHHLWCKLGSGFIRTAHGTGYTLGEK